MKAQIEHVSNDQAKPRILAIEDEPALSQVLSVVLKRAGFEVYIAATGMDGLRLADEQNCNLILSDIDLPDIRGFEVCERVKQNPRLRLIPIILVGAATVVAGDGAGLPHQLGMRLSLGGVVRAMGSGAPQARRHRVYWGGRDSLGQEQAGG